MTLAKAPLGTFCMKLHTLKCALVLATLPFVLTSCTSAPVRDGSRRPSALPHIRPLPSPHWPRTTQPIQRNPNLAVPADFTSWLNSADHAARVGQYEAYLRHAGVQDTIPTYQLLRSARDWQKCGAQPYAVPAAHLWGNLLPTLTALRDMKQRGVVTDIEVTSVYRDEILNACAGGAARSRHVLNSALDFRIGPETITTADQIRQITQSKTRLCDFWRQYGPQYQLGLGVYASGQIHIDTQGYRTWGPDHTAASSICSVDSEQPIAVQPSESA